jgi:RES domain-containing protein
MIVFRLAQFPYHVDLSGKGARINGGRWNSKGLPCIYTCSSTALCLTEILVNTPSGIIPKRYFRTQLEIPDNLPVYELPFRDYPSDWKAYPIPDSTTEIGDKFLTENKFIAMQVRSAIVPTDYNYVLNPLHKSAGKIRIMSVTKFEFDKRVFR